jgi:hypothetical protein
LTDVEIHRHAPAMTNRTAIKKGKFLAALARGISVTGAARLATISKNTIYTHRKRDQAFASAWDEALAEGTDYLVDEVRRRAVEGVSRPLVHQGRVVTRQVRDPESGKMEVEELCLREYSDVLLIFLLKCRDPERFDDATRLAALKRKWAKEDGQAGGDLIPAAAIISLLEEFEARKAALAGHGV